MKKFDVEVVTKMTLRVTAENERTARVKAQTAAINGVTPSVWFAETQSVINKCTEVKS